MAWCKLDATLRESVKPKRLARKLGIERHAARGLLAGLWSWALTYAPDGDLSGLEPEEIAEAADWQGDAELLFSALVEVRLVDHDGYDSARIHNWLERSGSYAENARRNKNRQKRKAKRLSRDGPGTVPGVSRARREEKRREEKRIEASTKNTVEETQCVIEKTDPVAGQIGAVWAHYCGYHPRAPGALSSSRKEYRLIRDRLSDGFSVDDIRHAIDGYHRSAWHQGANDRGKKYDSLELICRDLSHVQRGIEMRDNEHLQSIGQRDLQNIANAQAWLDED